MIISVDTGKTSDKIYYQFMLKITWQTKIHRKICKKTLSV